MIKYIIIFEDTIHDWPYRFYSSFEEAEKQRLYLSKTEGKVIKITIDL